MKINQIIVETATTAGVIATVDRPLGVTQKRVEVKGIKPVGQLGKSKKSGPYANSLSEGKVKELADDFKNLNASDFQTKYKKTKAEAKKALKPETDKVNEADLHEEDKILAPGKGSKLKPGLHGKNITATALSKFVTPFRSSGLYVSDRRGNTVCECPAADVAKEVCKALNMHVKMAESITSAGVIGNGAMGEGAKVDRMVKHVEKSEEKAGKSKKEAENIAWATANKRGMLDNKNKKAK